MKTVAPASPYYTIESTSLVLDNPQRRYILKIHDLPSEERPREKLLAQGPERLTPAELLAIVISTGTKKEDILAMSARIMKEYGEKSIMGARNAATLAHDLDIPLGKALQIVAAGELGRRFFQKNEAGMPVIRTARDVFDYVKDMRDLPKEHLRGLYLNTHFKVIRDELISIGTVDANMIHPREVFKPAIDYMAAAVVLVHNHPSGVAEPSAADLAVTEQLIAAGRMVGIELIDHVVVTKDDFISIPAHYTLSL